MASQTVKDILGQCFDHFALFGLIAASFVGLKFFLQICSGIRTYLLPKIFGLGISFRELGEWAVVTGSTDGIGKAYAEQLAQKGMNIVLISRSKDKLENVAREIESATGVKTKYIVADFSDREEIYDVIKSELQGLNVGILVNNVGVCYKFFDLFLDVENREQFFQDMVNVNIISTIMMTSIVLPGMVERKKGVIVNISSSSGMTPAPLLCVYSSSKAFVESFSTSLRKEYEDMGILVQCVSPFYVSTKLSGAEGHGLFLPTPTTFVRDALATVGVTSSTFGYWQHGLQGWFVSLLPLSLLLFLTTKALRAGRIARLKKSKEKKAN